MQNSVVGQLDADLRNLSFLDNKDCIQETGEIYTRSEVVEFILDLSGYTTEKPLYKMRILEPSFGGGDFLFSIIRRLFKSWKAANRFSVSPIELSNSIVAVELSSNTFQKTKSTVIAMLNQEEGLSLRHSEYLANCWLKQDDFLICDIEDAFDFVVGNPPYIRQEDIPQKKIEMYRSIYTTIFDRADIYVPFMERSLLLLKNKGNLGFICADRWMKNNYGKPLRKLISEKFNLKIYVDMVGTDAFQTDVSAYPAIVIIGREEAGATFVSSRPQIEKESLKNLALSLTSQSLNEDGAGIFQLNNVTNGSAPWLLSIPSQTELVRRIENTFPRLEDTRCKIRIGVATGADKAFIGKYDELPIENSRKLPLAMTKDIKNGEIHWRGYGVVNPFEDDGKLVNLLDYPALAEYFETKRDTISSRHCARKNPVSWYRTIDRINPIFLTMPKLLIPDIKNKPGIVYEDGKLYPHHNLYFVTSEEWELRALQAVLLSSIAKLFIVNYSVKIRGDYLRFQAQYLRRICLPHWKDVSEVHREELRKAAISNDISACNQIVFDLYGLSREEIKIIEETVQ